MDKPRNLWSDLCSYENLFLAYKKAKRGKSSKPYAIEFEKNLEENLLILRSELLLHSYTPKILKTFIVRDPKTRKISKSAFRDRVVHHALCNIIEPIFDKQFVYDSYANRLNKGTLKAVQRFDYFKRKASKNNTKTCHVLKADIKHYFETVDCKILIDVIGKSIKDNRVLWLIKKILRNYNIKNGKGMPLGNLTSQFFANVYLNKLDQFVKHKLKAKYYIRYVDDFVILHDNKKILQEYKEAINNYLVFNLSLDLHPNKSKIITLRDGVPLLGYRTFYYYKLLRKSNKRKFERKFNEKLNFYKDGLLVYNDFIQSLQGWFGYVMWANTYKLRMNLIKNLDTLKIKIN